LDRSHLLAALLPHPVLISLLEFLPHYWSKSQPSRLCPPLPSYFRAAFPPSASAFPLQLSTLHIRSSSSVSKSQTHHTQSSSFIRKKCLERRRAPSLAGRPKSAVPVSLCDNCSAKLGILMRNTAADGEAVPGTSTQALQNPTAPGKVSRSIIKLHFLT